MKKISITFGVPEFFVNEEKKTVACKLSGGLNVPSSIFDVLFSAGSKLPCPLNVELNSVAKCSPDDKFDSEKGKRIALAKAENKIHNYFFYNFYLPFRSYLYNLLKDLDFFFSNKSGDFIRYNIEYIDNLSNDVLKIKKPLDKGITKFISKKTKD